jgi:serine/threonine protein kinase
MAGAAGRTKRVGRYEVGRTIGQGTFAKVKFAVDADTGTAVAMKVLDKETIFTHRMLHQVPYLIRSPFSGRRCNITMSNWIPMLHV